MNQATYAKMESRIAQMADDEFREEFQPLLTEIRQTRVLGPVYVALDVDDDGELRCGFGRSKFKGVTHSLGPSPFMSYRELRNHLAGV